MGSAKVKELQMKQREDEGQFKVRKGWLHKQNEHHKWQKRWGVLTASTMSWSNKEVITAYEETQGYFTNFLEISDCASVELIDHTDWFEEAFTKADAYEFVIK